MTTETSEAPEQSTPTTKTDDGRPKLWLTSSGLWMAEIGGKLVSSPNREPLAQKLGLEASAQERARAERQAATDATDARKQAAADRLPGLEAAVKDAAADLEAAWRTFTDAAVHGNGGIVASYVAWRNAFRRHDAARLHVAEATYEAQHGTQRQHGGGNPPPDLTACLDRAVAEHEADLRRAGS